MIGRRPFALGALVLLALGGCTLPAGSRRWAGRFSLRAQGPQGAVSETGRFEFVEGRRGLRLDLLTPLNGVVARIESSPEGAFFYRGGEATPEVDADLDRLLMRLLGFTLPVNALPELLEGRTDTLSSSGWTGTVLARREDGRVRTARIERAASSTTPAVLLTVVLDE